ncbi:hypothetical protein CR513_54572, partial [Mucuna pruriens]
MDLIVKQVMESFCIASGLMVNIQNSVCNLPRIKNGKFSSLDDFQHTYKIGLPIMSRRVKNNDFAYVLDKINTTDLVGGNSWACYSAQSCPYIQPFPYTVCRISNFA